MNNNNNGSNNNNNGPGNNSPSSSTSSAAPASTSPSSPHHHSALAGKYVAAIVVCSVLAALIVLSVLLLCYYRRRRAVADQALTSAAAQAPPAPNSVAAYFQARRRGGSRGSGPVLPLAEQRQPSADMGEQVLADGVVEGSDEWMARMEQVGAEGVVRPVDRPGMVERGSMTTPFDRQLRSEGHAGLRGAVEGGGVTQEERPLEDGEVLPTYQQATVGRRGRGLRLPR